MNTAALYREVIAEHYGENRARDERLFRPTPPEGDTPEAVERRRAVAARALDRPSRPWRKR